MICFTVQKMSDRTPTNRWLSDKIQADAQYVNKWLDPYYSQDRLVDWFVDVFWLFVFSYDKLLKPRLELVVRNLNRPHDDKETDPILLDTYR